MMDDIRKKGVVLLLYVHPSILYTGDIRTRDRIGHEKARIRDRNIFSSLLSLDPVLSSFAPARSTSSHLHPLCTHLHGAVIDTANLCLHRTQIYSESSHIKLTHAPLSLPTTHTEPSSHDAPFYLYLHSYLPIYLSVSLYTPRST